MYRLLILAFSSAIAMMIVAGLLAAHPLAAPGAGRGSAAASGDGADRDDSSGDGEQTEIKRDASGQFHLTAQVNSQDTQFLVDTGADVVALTIEDARHAGVDVDPASFEPMMQTASGTGSGAAVHLERFEVNGEEFRGVDAVVLEGLPVSLLGQPILRRMGQVELHGDRMIIRRGT